MKLIIAEKPSLGRNIVAGIGKMMKMDGYYEGGDYIVTWAFGHLFGLKDIEEYPGVGVFTPEGKPKWVLDNLPYYPEPYQFKLRGDSGVKKQYDVICKLMNRKDVDTIINAGDSDREGEIIVRLIIMHGLKSKKKLERLWLPDQTPETVAKGLKDIKSEDEYENLANEGFARTCIDWLYGINLTRYASIKSGSFLRVGRVVVPIVKAVYDRDKEISEFVPQDYFVCVSEEETNGEVVELTSKKKFDNKADADAYRIALNKQPAVVTLREDKDEVLNPGKLYSLSKLQNVLGKKYKMNMEKSLSVIQGLYEKGYVTYPRTNSEYLATAEKEKVKSILTEVGKIGFPVVFKDKKSIFDDSKIESHSALTPTTKIPVVSDLSEDEQNVYQTILSRFVAVFCAEECKAKKSKIVVSIDGYEDFTLNGTVIEVPGWTKYDSFNKVSVKTLPSVKKGDVIETYFEAVKKQTSPPSHYTIETLNNYLKNPFKSDKGDEDEDAEYKAVFAGLELGTEATRTGIISNAIASNYINLKKDVYTITPTGINYIEMLDKLGIVMDKYRTSELGKALKSVYRAEMTGAQAADIAKREINEIFEKGKELKIDRVTPPAEIIGKCPACGGNIVKKKDFYGCDGYKNGCKFTLPTVLCKTKLTTRVIKSLLTKGESCELEFTSKAGKKFRSKLVIKDGKMQFDF